ncbi:MAG: ComEA family DNA-binding protein [Actinomycetaceae bacterium]|nr:ComEA family DNA-binding protein [Actinomycetaceae bacterium]
MLRILNLRRKSTLRRLRQKAYDSAMKGSSEKSPPPAVRIFPSPVTTVALAIALIAAVLFSFMRLGAPADDAVLEGEPATSQGAEAGYSEGVEATSQGAEGEYSDGVEETSQGAEEANAEGARGGFVMVQVTGAVRTPSVVRVPAGSRGVDAVNEAGGLTEDASLASVNLAVQVVDGQHIHVLTTEEASDAGIVGGTAPGGAGGTSGAVGVGGSGGGVAVAGPGGSCIDVRTADQVTLQLLPGIGPALAARIEAYRAENGLQNPEDIRGVSGIGAKTYDGFKDMLCP